MEKINEYVWINKIPIQVNLCKDDIATDLEINPTWLLVPRIHYIWLYYDRIHDIFKEHIPEVCGRRDMWLSYEGVAVDWNIPFGVFFDMHVEEGNKRKVISLTLSYRNKPEKLKYLLDYKEEESYFFDLKQASCIRRKDRKANNVLSSMPKENRDLMWRKFVEEKRVEFYQFFNTLWEKKNEHDRLFMPTRILIKNFEGRIQRRVEVDPSKGKTVRDLLNDYFPSFFENGKLLEKFQNLKVLWHGSVLQLTTPLTFMMENFLYMDSFVYLVIKF